ncbi:ORF4 [Ranid herpesvirus 1]|uniref:ORF4 n=1 Tax=Ranid herpesvirus 1 TaxID=85655 RepID=Q14VV4_9VIRU|nr:ORF4 [Ranid herpesvirus 1]ABG25809.1 ORF4 [Ranid herpesvirus 1]
MLLWLGTLFCFTWNLCVWATHGDVEESTQAWVAIGPATPTGIPQGFTISTQTIGIDQPPLELFYRALYNDTAPPVVYGPGARHTNAHHCESLPGRADLEIRFLNIALNETEDRDPLITFMITPEAPSCKGTIQCEKEAHETHAWACGDANLSSTLLIVYTPSSSHVYACGDPSNDDKIPDYRSPWVACREKQMKRVTVINVVVFMIVAALVLTCAFLRKIMLKGLRGCYWRYGYILEYCHPGTYRVQRV